MYLNTWYAIKDKRNELLVTLVLETNKRQIVLIRGRDQLINCKIILLCRLTGIIRYKIRGPVWEPERGLI